MYTVTDVDLYNYIDQTLPVDEYDVDDIVTDLRPHVVFGDVSPDDYIGDDEADAWQLFSGGINRVTALIHLMLASSGIDEEQYWTIVSRHVRDEALLPHHTVRP